MTQVQKIGVAIAMVAILGAVFAGIYGRSRMVGAPEPAEVYVPASTEPTPSTIYVHVAGAVLHPDVYPLQADARVWNAVQAAGGFLANAEQTAVNLAAPLADGDRIEIPFLLAGVPQTSPPVSVPQGGVLDLNTATREQLDGLPGIGPELAGRIVEYRRRNGPFREFEDLQMVEGIGAKRLSDIRGLATVQPQQASQ